MVDSTNADQHDMPPFPSELEALAHIEFDIRGGSGVDFNLWRGFSRVDVAIETLQPGSADPTETATTFWQFGQDRIGGRVAFWQVRADCTVVDQPIVFLGCDGELGVVARDFGDFLWLLADGYGPKEAVEPRGFRPVPNLEVAELAVGYAHGERQTAASVIGRARTEFPDFEDAMAGLRYRKPVNFPPLFPSEMARATPAEVSEKVERLRSLLRNTDDYNFRARFPPGAELDEQEILDTYRRFANTYTEDQDDSAESGSSLDDLRLPRAMIELFRITDSPETDSIELDSNPWHRKGEIMDPDGQVHRQDEHWLKVGILTNDHFLVSLTSGEVMFSDQYFWRYAEKNASRIVAPDLLTFFNEYMIGPRYREFAYEEDLEDPAGWYAFLRDNGFA